MRVVVTGATGNLGTALLRRLVTADGYDVVGISRRRPPDAPPYDGVPWHPIDIGSPSAPQPLADALRGADAVVHLAWMIQPSHDRELLRRTNQDGTRAVLDAARREGVAHFVHVSSLGTYSAGPPGTRVDESWPADGIATSSYSVDKAACERMLDGVEGELLVTRVRPSVVLQPDAASEITRYFLGPLVPMSLVRQPLLRLVPFPPGVRVQFVHADDVADALELILRTRAGGAFNLAAEPAMDRELWRITFGGVGPPVPVKLLRAAAQLTWLLRIQPTDRGWVDMGTMVPLLDTGRARELGWAPKHSGTEALLQLLSAMRRRDGGAGPLLYPRRVH
jgi:nucleoside-diphosphate-sugar epimerase